MKLLGRKSLLLFILGATLLNGIVCYAESGVHEASPMLVQKDVESENKGLTAEAFNKNYTAINRPSIAIYVNREFTSEVREWSATTREFSEEQKGKGETKNDVAVVKTSQVRRHLEERPRNPPTELELWAFEEAFFKPFLNTGARLVDRAVMLRLMAAQSDQSKEYETVKLKKIEMDALSSFAEIFVEVLIAEDPLSQSGYQFRAQATEVNTAQILVNVTSSDLDKMSFSGKGQAAYTAGSAGYETIKVNRSNQQMEFVAEHLAYLLMAELSEYWAARSKVY